MKATDGTAEHSDASPDRTSGEAGSFGGGMAGADIEKRGGLATVEVACPSARQTIKEALPNLPGMTVANEPAHPTLPVPYYPNSQAHDTSMVHLTER